LSNERLNYDLSTTSPAETKSHAMILRALVFFDRYGLRSQGNKSFSFRVYRKKVVDILYKNNNQL